MNFSSDFNFLILDGDILSQETIKSDRFQYIFLDAQKFAQENDTESVKESMDRYLEKVYLFDSEAIFWYAKFLEENEQRELSQLYFQIGKFAQSLQQMYDHSYQEEIRKSLLSFISLGLSEPILLASLYAIGETKNIPDSFYTSRSISFRFSKFLKDTDNKNLQVEEYTILFEEDFLLKPLFLEIFGRELHQKKYFYLALQYEEFCFQSNGEYFSTYRNTLLSSIAGLDSGAEKLFFLIQISYYESPIPYMYDLIEELFYLSDTDIRYKVLELLGEDFFGKKLFSFLLRFHYINAPDIDILSICELYIEFANDEYYHEFLKNKLFFSYLYGYLAQKKEFIESHYDLIIETLKSKNLISIFQKYDIEQIIFQKSNYRSKKRTRYVFEMISFSLTIAMFLVLLFGFLTIFIIIFSEK